MPVTGACQFGGTAYTVAGAGTSTLSWGPLRIVQVVYPTVALADVRLPAADGLEFRPDHGIGVFYVFNAHPSNDVRLRDQAGRVDVTISNGQGAIVSRYFSGATPHFFADIRDVLA